MKKLFISQPMRGRTDEQILAERKKAVEKAIEIMGEPVEVLDTYFEDFKLAKGKNIPLQYLSKSISFLAEADVAYFAKGWENARGCKIEHDCAVAYGIKVIEA